jgi:hypothetical protein
LLFQGSTIFSETSIIGNNYGVQVSIGSFQYVYLVYWMICPMVFSKDMSDSVRYLREAVKANPESRQAAIPDLWSEPM